jgi:ureidoacrylate peracid hydrolase
MTGATTAVTIQAQPAPITIDPVRTAVLVVDMQNDFGSRDEQAQLAICM